MLPHHHLATDHPRLHPDTELAGGERFEAASALAPSRLGGLDDDALDAATDRLVAAARAAVVRAFEAAGMSGFAEAIVHERVRTPPGWRDAYGLARGSVGSLSSASPRKGLLRLRRRPTMWRP